MCYCCSPEIRDERVEAGYPPCKKMAAPRKVGAMLMTGKTAVDLTITDPDSMRRLMVGARRIDHRLLSDRNGASDFLSK